MSTKAGVLGWILAAAIGAGAAAEGPKLAFVPAAKGLSRPLSVCFPPGDFSRLFIVEQRVDVEGVSYGRVKILDLKTGKLLPDPYITVGPVRVDGGSSGLLGMAFDPDYANNGSFYLYSVIAGGPLVQLNVVDRYQVTADPNVADANSRERILTIEDPHNIHNGGCMYFGPDGMLYIATGDGGPGGDPDNRAQNKGLLFGKILRLDVSGQDDFPVDPDQNYHCPADNPFVGQDGRDEVWAYGLRHPWRFSFDRVTGDMYIGDVGQGKWEEVNFLPAGRAAVNFGWRCMEGADCTGKTGCTCNDDALTEPIHAFNHGDEGNPCSITGGFVYRGCAIPDLDGVYLCTDYCTRRIWTLRYDGQQIIEPPTDITDQMDIPQAEFRQLVAWGEDAYGELYVCNINDGNVFKLVTTDPIEADCNTNGREDACDIASGSSADQDVDGIPDECQPQACYADCDGNKTLDLFDFLCFVNRFNAGKAEADCTEDGKLDLFDFLCFVNDFNAGC